LSNDAVELFRQDGAQYVPVCRATDGQIASAFTLGVKVTRDEYGVWRLYLDPSGGMNYQFACLGAEGSYTASSWTGVRCTYTSANATRFYFDDFYAGPLQSDTVLSSAVAEHSVLFNEIYFEPAAAGIPSVEFVELVNRTTDTVWTEGWRISDGSAEARLPVRSFIPPHGFIVFCSSTNLSLWQGWTGVTGTAGFPGLNNDVGDELILTARNGMVIDRVTFNDGSYHDDTKTGGGWTIERIDTGFVCQNADNWGASRDPDGGTPGRSNSIAGSFHDHEAPWISAAWLPDSFTLRVTFSERMGSLRAEDVLVTAAGGTPYVPDRLTMLDEFSAELSFVGPLPERVFIRPRGTMSDCPGNAADTLHFLEVATASVPVSGEVILNELLFESAEGTSDFIEVLNRSPRAIDLQGVSVVETDANLSIPSGPGHPLTTDHELIFPGEVKAWTRNVRTLREAFPVHDKYRIGSMADLPDFNAEEGGVVLLSMAGDTLDKMSYSRQWHYPLLTDTRGISLERMHAAGISTDRTVWHSAATLVGGATPGRKNSQSYETTGGNGELQAIPRIISPDNDGIRDVLMVRYRFPDAGRLLAATVFSEAGRQISIPVDHELAGAEGIFTWDGTDESGLPVPGGRYVLFVETISMSGSVRHYKEPVGVHYR
jgi:hypothetical protein